MSEVTVLALGRPDRGIVARAGEASTDLVWLLDAAARPLEGALEALLEHADRPAASLPVDASGTPIDALAGRFVEDDVSDLLAAVGNRVVPLRHAPLISLLVRRDVVTGMAPPDPGRFGPWAGDEWTARLLAAHPGVLVPASRVRAGAGRPAARLPQAWRMARSGVWGRGEMLRELHGAAARRAGAGRRP